MRLMTVFVFMIFFVSISFVHSRDLKWFYIVKSFFVFAAMHAVFIWYMVKSNGASWTNIAASKPLDNSTHIWLVLRAFNTGLGAASSLTVNQGDMTRYADKPRSAIWVSHLSTV
jgi:NCS1 family nucleobase:cation symporter-1